MRNLGDVAVAAAAVSLSPTTPTAAADGDLDPTFGIDGTVVTDLGKGNSSGYALTIDGADYIYVTGAADNGTNLDTFLARFTPTGVLDPTFGSAGQPLLATILSQVDLTFGGAIVTTGIPGNAYHADVAIGSGSGMAGGRTQDVGPGGQPRLAVSVEEAVLVDLVMLVALID